MSTKKKNDKSTPQLELFPRISEIDQTEGEKQIAELQKIVDYEIKEYTIELLVHKYKEGEANDTNDIFIPKYQRKFIWDESKQSLFIESLLLGLPIPYMFTADSPENEGRSEIVDGSQRLRTLRYFLENKLVLVNLEKLTKIEGFRFCDLPLSRQRRFKKKTIRLIELTEKADWEVRKDIFSRINKTPSLLSDMEIRRGVYEGKFLDFIQECAGNIKLHMLCPVSEKRTEREEYAEMVLRFFAYSDKYMKFVHRVDEFLNTYTQDMSKHFDAAQMAEDFENMLDFVEKHFPYGFKKTENHASTPRVRFEAIAVGVNLALKEKPNLKLSVPVIEWLESVAFLDQVTTDAANNRNKVIGRIEFVRDKLLGKR
jgi:hypothetical protein